jgi:hypothetical protein
MMNYSLVVEPEVLKLATLNLTIYYDHNFQPSHILQILTDIIAFSSLFIKWLVTKFLLRYFSIEVTFSDHCSPPDF